MEASWESAAIISAVGVLLTAVFTGVVRMMRAMRSSADDVKKHTEQALTLANGFPVSFVRNLHIPAWYKDRSGKMKFINPAYTKVFGVMDIEYVGRFDRDVWPSAIAEQFARHDQQVLTQGIPIQVLERVPRRDNPELEDLWLVTKFPVIDPVTTDVKGVGGYAIPSVETKP